MEVKVKVINNTKNAATDKAVRKFTVGITENFFVAHGRQLIQAQYGLLELIDNALSNPKDRQTANVLLDISPVGENRVRFTVADWGRGMDADELINALQFGSKHSGKEGKLCIYGIGLNNALLGLTLHEPSNKWLIASRKPNEKRYHVVKGLFALEMEMEDTDELPYKELVMQPEMVMFGEPSTVVSVVTDYKTASTMLSTSSKFANSGKPNLNLLRRAMAEHIGVLYCNALDSTNGHPDMRVLITNYTFADKRKQNTFIKAIKQPYTTSNEYEGYITLNGAKVRISITEGILNKKRLSRLVTGEYASEFYYKGNQKTQGVDIIMGNRTIATGVLEDIFHLTRHPDFNLWTGRIVIDTSNLPRDFIKTLANKSSIDVRDPNWEKIFELVRMNASPRKAQLKTMDDYRRNFADALLKLHPGYQVLFNYPVYGTRTKIDILLVHPDQKTVEAYDVTKNIGSCNDLSALRTNWDGLVAAGWKPVKATLICRKDGPMLRTVAEEWNKGCQFTVGRPTATTPFYNFSIVEDPNNLP